MVGVRAVVTITVGNVAAADLSSGGDSGVAGSCPHRASGGRAGAARNSACHYRVQVDYQDQRL